MSVTRRLTPLLSLAFAAMLVGSCGGDDDDASADGGTSGAGVKVVATTTQIGALAREVAGGKVELTVLLGAGSEAHDYEPDPSAIRRISVAQVILKNGIGLDDWLDKSIESAGGAKRVVTVTDGAALAPGGDDEEGEFDPHVWHDVDNAKVMVDNLSLIHI